MQTKTTRLWSQSFGELGKRSAHDAPLDSIFDELVYKKPDPAKGTITGSTPPQTLPLEAAETN